MANRFGEQYRPPHSGRDVFGGSMGPSTNPNQMNMHIQPWGGEDSEGYFTQTGADKKYNFKKDKRTTKGGYSGKSGDINYEKGDENPHGGSTVPRKPKPKTPKSSGGMALEIPRNNNASKASEKAKLVY